MKEQNQALEKVMSWAREAQGRRTFELSPNVRATVLAAWRRESVGDWNESILSFLRWGVAYSLVIMAISILVSANMGENEEVASHDYSPHVVFHSRLTHEIYGP